MAMNIPYIAIPRASLMAAGSIFPATAPTRVPAVHPMKGVRGFGVELAGLKLGSLLTWSESIDAGSLKIVHHTGGKRSFGSYKNKVYLIFSAGANNTCAVAGIHIRQIFGYVLSSRISRCYIQAGQYITLGELPCNSMFPCSRTKNQNFQNFPPLLLLLIQ